MTRRHGSRVDPSDVGCWVAGDWGQYGSVRVCDIATDLGGPEFLPYNVDEAMKMDPLDRDEWEPEAADNAEDWLNANAAPEGYSFGWYDGEFYFWPDSNWEELSW